VAEGRQPGDVGWVGSVPVGDEVVESGLDVHRLPCTTGYLQDAIDARRAEGHHVSEEAIAHLSPAHFEAINPYGTLSFDVGSQH